jgi:type I restriction enzyme S subunit
MSEWKETTWGNVSTLEYGKPVDYKELDGKVPVYGTNGQIGFTNSEPLCKFPSVIVGRKGAYRGIHFSSVPFCLIDTGFFLKPISKDIIDIKFAYYSLLNTDINRLDSGSAIPSTSRPDFYQLYLSLPPLKEQKQIADVLSCLDAKIENLRRQNETLEQIAQTLFKHWFIDFEFPNADGKPYKSSGGAMVASELGDIPKGWKVGKLKDISDITSSKRIFSAEYVESGIPFYRSKEIIELHAGKNVTTELYISEEKFNEIKSKFEVPKADEILLTSVGTIGVPYLIKKSDQFYFKDGNLTWIKRFKNGFSGVVIYYWLKSESTQAKIKQNTIGSTQKALTIQALGNISIFIPDPKTLSRYTEFIKIVNSKIENNIYQIQTLTKTRDSLLPKLMSGQLRVKE